MQISMFDGAKPFKINKSIRLIELFGGYGSQSLALKYLDMPFQHHKLSEWAVKSIQAYKDLHFSEDNTDYSANLNDLEIVDFLDGRISSDYQTPMTREQITKHNGGEKWRRQVYNNMKATNNLGSIMKINGNDLEITDTDKYCYIMTYSFPCQDLSSAGKGKGMGRDSGTRSGLLWEVERLLKETPNLPQVLLMENVPEVIGAKNIKHFAEWQAFLEKLGYKNKWECLNAKDFGIAQNRNRCFMVSILGDYYYDMPKGFKLEHRLKHFLDKEVDESYYLKDETVKQLNIDGIKKVANNEDGNSHTVRSGGGTHSIDTVGILLSNQGKHLDKETDIANTLMARDYKGFGNQSMNGVVEIYNRPHGYNKGGLTKSEVYPTIRKSSTIDGNNGVLEWKKK